MLKIQKFEKAKRLWLSKTNARILSVKGAFLFPLLLIGHTALSANVDWQRLTALFWSRGFRISENCLNWKPMYQYAIIECNTHLDLARVKRRCHQIIHVIIQAYPGEMEDRWYRHFFNMCKSRWQHFERKNGTCFLFLQCAIGNVAMQFNYITIF